MAGPLSASAFLKALKDEGLTVVETPGWRTHNRNSKGAWGPVNGVMMHHTVTSGTAASVAICRNGYSGLPGPLCHGVIDKAGVVHLVGYGRTNHAGLGDDDVLRQVIAESYGTTPTKPNEANTDGNRHFYGFECVNLGDGKDPWPAAQLLSMDRAAAAILRAHKSWGPESLIGHKEWQPGKPDPIKVSMPDMRKRVGVLLKGKPGGQPAPKPKPAPTLADALKSITALEKRVTALEKKGG